MFGMSPKTLAVYVLVALVVTLYVAPRVKPFAPGA